MRLSVIALLLLPSICPAQALSRADSALVGRILLAEDRRDSTDAALAEGTSASDSRIRLLAQRARWRIRDARFVARDSLPPLPAPPAYPEPAWRLRFRALTTKSSCDEIQRALADSAWPVRLRAADVAIPACGSSADVVATLRTWVDQLPAHTATRTAGNVSWHAGAHAIMALARLSPSDARARLPKLAAHSQWEVRMYAARAATELADTSALRRLAKDPDGNVQEAAITGLSKLVGHGADDLYLAALRGNQAQAVRAAALALKGSPSPDLPSAASRTFARWTALAIASARDVRVALLDAMGRPASDDRPPALKITLPPRAVALALGQDVRIRVTMSPASGGGSFVVRLRGDIAPMMSADVLELVRLHYYDHGVWHRVENDFVIQGGGPGTNEYVGARDFLRDELGNVPHVRGTVGMSTRAHDTGDAQWFINLKDNPRLGRDYTVFAEVVEGIDVVDGILEGDVVDRMREVSARR